MCVGWEQGWGKKKNTKKIENPEGLFNKKFCNKEWREKNGYTMGPTATQYSFHDQIVF